MDEPLLVAVASAVATGSVAGLTDAGGAALRDLVRVVTERFARTTSSQAILDAAQDGSTNDAVTALTGELRSATAGDQLFAHEVRRLWQEVQQHGPAASDGGVVNTISGDVYGPVVQTRDVTGGIAFGSIAPDRRERK